MRAFLLATILVIAATVGADAQKTRRAAPSIAELCELLSPCLPPAAFASGPFLGRPVVRHVGMSQLSTICNGGGYGAHNGDLNSIHAFTSGGETLGCAQLAGNECVIHLPLDLHTKLPALYRLVRNHELGHCRGWTH